MDNTNSYSASFCGEYRVKHILIKPIISSNMDAGEIAKAKEEAKVKAQDIILKLINGGNWTNLVKKYSDDKLSITRDGLMKNFRRSEVEEILYDTVEKLRDGRYTNFPIEASDGYHILFRINKTEDEEESKEETDETSEEEIKEEKEEASSEENKKEKNNGDNSYDYTYETERKKKKKSYGISDYEYDSVSESITSRVYAENEFSENITQNETVEHKIENQVEQTVETNVTGQNQVNYTQNVGDRVNTNVDMNINQHTNASTNTNIDQQINIKQPIGGNASPRGVNIEATILSNANIGVGVGVSASNINSEQPTGTQVGLAGIGVVPPTMMTGVQPQTSMNIGGVAPVRGEEVSDGQLSEGISAPLAMAEETQGLENEGLSEGGDVLQNASEVAPPTSTNEQPFNNVNGGMNPRQTLRNTGSSPKLQERLERSRGKNLFNNLLNRNNRQNTDSDSDNKNPVQKAGEKVAEKGASAAAQSAGVPKPIADALSKELVGPLLEEFKKRYRRKLIIIASCIAAAFLVILIPVIIIAGDSDYQAAESENRSNYLYGSGSEEDLYEYLINMGLCSNSIDCASTDAAAFYKKLKSVMNNNSNLTSKQSDSFIIKMIFYERQNEEAYKHSDEIEYIANIIGQDAAFDVTNAQAMMDSFVQEDGYFDTYRQDLLVEDNSIEHKQEMFNEIYENAVSFANILSENEYDPTLIGGTCSYNVNGKIVSDVKVRLLECTDHNTAKPINDELIDFEKYITGVVYGELADGSRESFKTEAIAARNYVLLRGNTMEGNLGLEKENGEWILSIRNCTKDQVYCDPDKGCWTNHETAGDTVYSGTNENKAWGKGPLSENSELRKAVAETAGKVLVDSNGKLVSTPYTNVQHQEWKRQANAGKDHFEILKSTYPSATKIISTCSSSITGDFRTWKQCGAPWSSIKLGNSNSDICDAGCYMTSIAIQMASSGTKINTTEFNPGVLVKNASANNAFSSSGSLKTFAWNNLAPNFKFYKNVSLTGNESDKAATIKSYQNQGYYVVIRARTHQHWVALDHVEGSEVYMYDPASYATKLWEKYPSYDVTRITIFQNLG